VLINKQNEKMLSVEKGHGAKRLVAEFPRKKLVSLL